MRAKYFEDESNKATTSAYVTALQKSELDNETTTEANGNTVAHTIGIIKKAW